jgi:mannose-6-phosphate isomerase-like protein (cupin superfamily)
MMQVISDAGSYTRPAPDGPGSHWAEHFRTADLSVGTYSLRAGGIDGQVPHTEDEIYVVTAGSATLVAGDESAVLRRGAVVFVAAGEPHHFTDVTEDLALLVLFAPAEDSRAGQNG